MRFWSALTEEKYILLFHDLLKYMAEFYIHTADGLADCFEQGMVDIDKSRGFCCYIIKNMAVEFMCSEQCSTKKASLITNALSKFTVNVYEGDIEKLRLEERFYDSLNTIENLVESFIINCIDCDFDYKENIESSMKKHSKILFQRVFLSISKGVVVRK